MTTKKLIIFILKLCITAGLVFFVGSALRKDFQKVQLRVLNSYIPRSYDCLIALIQDNGTCDERSIRQYIRYYQIVAFSLPKRDEAYGMLGFCYHHLGKTKEAVEYYRKATTLNPYYFWHHYNLGLIFYNAGHYQEAEKSFKNAVELGAEGTLKMTVSSKVYRDILGRMRKVDYSLQEQLISGYRGAYQLLILIDEQANNFPGMYSYATRAIKLGFEKDGSLNYSAGRAAYELKEYEKAVIFLQESLKLREANADAYNYLGLSLKALGKDRVASALQQRAQRIRNAAASENRQAPLTRVRFF